jgi:hypothetical protein
LTGELEFHSLQVQIIRYEQAKTDEHRCQIARAFFEEYMDGKSDALLTLNALSELNRRVSKLEQQLKEDNPHEETHTP